MVLCGLRGNLEGEGIPLGDFVAHSTPLDPGSCYLIEERRAEISYGLLSTLTGLKTAGMVITRQFPDRIRAERVLPDLLILWLSHTPGETSISPTAIDALSKTIRNFIEHHNGEAVILVDGLEYLIVNNGFALTLSFIEQLNDIVRQGKAIVLLPLDPGALGDKELARLKRTLKVLGPRPPRTAVRLIPERADLVQECNRLRDSLPANSDVDDSSRPLEEKIRGAQRLRIPFTLLISGGETRSKIFHVIQYKGRDEWIGLDSLLRAIKDWESSGW